MASHDDDRFRVRPAPPKGRAGAGNVQRSRRFVSQVLKEVSKAGATASGALGARPASTFGRGRVAARMAGRGLGANARRVVIKSRYVVLKKAGANSVSTHLRYIERAGVARDGGGGQAYGSEADAADLNAFEERRRGDRHQFRFIVSVEDAEQLDELRSFTREFMQRMSADLETRLDWIAVDHWDTDNPHTHVVLRGRAANGQDLIIAPDYMAQGMRMRASELATEWLGPRTELEIQQGLLREVEQERLTSLDRVLLRQATVDVVDLTEKPGDRQRQAVLRARLQRLEAMGLAGRIDANHWRLTHHMEPTLTEMGERGDIVRTVHKALKGEQRLLALDSGRAMSVVGRIAAKGLADEMDDRSYLVVDGIDGLAHYVKLPAGTDITKLPIGGIVETKPPRQERAVDRTISSLARDGVYRVADHLARLQQDSATDPQSTVDAHVRRLEALRRVGVVERVADGVWRVPGDFVSRARDHNARKAAAITVELRSHLPLEQQVRSLGATWLDQQLLADGQGLAAQGFGGHVRGAMQSRVDLLFEQGLAKRQGQRVTLARDLLATLRDRELASVGKALQNKTGLIYRPLRHGERASGVYRRSLQLASGRFAVLDNGMGFCLVPWRPVIELRLGQHLAATVRGGWASWEIGRGLGPSVG